MNLFLPFFECGNAFVHRDFHSPYTGYALPYRARRNCFGHAPKTGKPPAVRRPFEENQALVNLPVSRNVYPMKQPGADSSGYTIPKSR